MSRFATPIAFLLALSLLATGLTACDSGGEDDPPPPEEEEEDATAPAAPSGLEASPEEGAVSLDWSAPPDDDVDGYNIYRSESSFSSPGGAQRINSGGLTSGTDFRDTGAEEGATYYYRVTAVDEADNESDLSDEASTSPLDTTAPAAPSNLSGSSEDGAVSLNWSAPSSDDVEGYNVYRSTSEFSSTGEAQKLNSGGLASEASYRDGTAENGTRYYYRVAAVDEAGNESDLSESLEKTPLPDPPDNP